MKKSYKVALVSLAIVASWGAAALRLCQTPDSLPEANYTSHQNVSNEAVKDGATLMGMPEADVGEIRKGPNDVRVDLHGKETHLSIRMTEDAMEITNIRGETAKTTIIKKDGDSEQYTQAYSTKTGVHGNKYRTLEMLVPAPVRSYSWNKDATLARVVARNVLSCSKQ